MLEQVENEGRLSPGIEGAFHATKEREKYNAIWAKENYHATSPGERWAKLAFRQITRSRPPNYVLDLGCGAGSGAAALHDIGYRVAGLDLVRDQFALEGVPFFEQPLWEPIPLNPATGRRWSYGFCCDVMEHIPTDLVDAVLASMAASCNGVFFSIAHNHDACGALIGETLHLTVKPFEWWVDKLREHFDVLTHGRDLIGEGLYYTRMRRG
jgi:SAM-dependent methyltransferase